MTDALETRVRLLEKELQEKDQLITTLQRFSVFSLLFGSYMHEMYNKMGTLSLYLSSHFALCRTKGIEDKDINEITRVFEDLRDLHNTMDDTFTGRRQECKVSIEECIQASINILDHRLRRYKTKLIIEPDTYPGKIRVPKRDFTQVILIVLMNALDALQEITNRERVIKVQTIFDGKQTSITIQDNGHGIDKNTMTKVWEQGFTIRRGRSGLGLTWAKMFIEKLLGGQITVESKLDEFTKISILLPEEQEHEHENAPLD